MRRRPPRSTRTDTLFPTRRSSDIAMRGKSGADIDGAVGLALDGSGNVFASRRFTGFGGGRFCSLIVRFCLRGHRHLVGRARGDRTDRDRKSVVSGKRVSVRVALGGRRILKKKK